MSKSSTRWKAVYVTAPRKFNLSLPEQAVLDSLARYAAKHGVAFVSEQRQAYEMNATRDRIKVHRRELRRKGAIETVGYINAETMEFRTLEQGAAKGFPPAFVLWCDKGGVFTPLPLKGGVFRGVFSRRADSPPEVIPSLKSDIGKSPPLPPAPVDSRAALPSREGWGESITLKYRDRPDVQTTLPPDVDAYAFGNIERAGGAGSRRMREALENHLPDWQGRRSKAIYYAESKGTGSRGTWRSVAFTLYLNGKGDVWERVIEAERKRAAA